MGNLSSQEEDSYFTDDSLSVMSEQSARMRPSRRNPNVPVEPPEADLSHLTEEERAHILSVLARARDLQAKDERRVRDLEDEFSNYAASVLQKASDAAAAETEEGASGKHRDLCPICHVTELVPDPQPGTAQEGQACEDCDRIVCLQCGFYTPGVTSDTETWLCNMCQRRRRFLATSGLWHVGRRNKRFSGSRLQRRSSLDETESALKRAAKKSRKLERMASYSQYEEMRAQPDQQKTPEGANTTSPSPLQGATASSPSSVAAPVGASTNEPKTATDLREEFAARTESVPPSKPPRSISREDERSTVRPVSESSLERDHSDPEAQEGIIESVAANHLGQQQDTGADDSDADFDEEEMMRQLLEMAGDGDGVHISHTGDPCRDITASRIAYRDTEGTDASAHEDLSNNSATISCEETREHLTQLDSAQTGQYENELSHPQRTFGDLDVLYEGDELEGIGDWESGREIRRRDAESASATSLLTERERELIRDSCKESRTKTRGFIDHRSSSVDSSANDEPKARSKRKILKCSFDSYESLSDSEIKSTETRQNPKVQKMGIMSGSDPKLSSDSDPPHREPITSSKESLQKLFVPQLSPEEFVSDEKYRSVEDLTKVGTDEPELETAVEEETSSSRVATPAVGQPQFQFVKQKPNSLPRRRRSRPVMELPLSPIFDEETASPDLEHPAGDFSSPEYADPSLAEESPFEYEYEDDADASQEGFSSQDELPRTEVIEDLEAMEEDASVQSDIVDEFAVRVREEGLETLVEEQEETQECDFRRTSSKQTDMDECTTSDAIQISPNAETHTPVISQDTESQITEETLSKRICNTEQDTFGVDETAGQDRSSREKLKNLQRYSQDDANSSSSLTSSQSSEEPPDTVQPHKDEKNSHPCRPKPPPLGMMPPRYSMEAYSSMESEEGNSLLSSPRSPSYDTDGFDKPKVRSPGKKRVDPESPLSPGFRFSPPATPKHLLEASKHMSDSSCTYDNSPSEFSDEIQMSPVTLTVRQPVALHGHSNSDDFFGVPVKAREVPKESEAICPNVPLDNEQINEAAQSNKTNEVVKTYVIEQSTPKADACTSTQTEHILSVMIPKPSSTHRHPVEEGSQPVKTLSTSSQTTSPILDAEPGSGSPSMKQAKAKILVDAAVDATFDSPSLSPQSPMHAVPAKTASIAVGTSPEYSPPSSAPSTDTESVASRSSRVKYVQGGFGSDGDTTDWGASMPFSSIASSSGTSSPERSSSLRSTPLKCPSYEPSSLSNVSPPTVRRSRVDRETSSQRSSSVPGRARLMRENASERRTSSSDIDSCDSDGGTPSSTPRKIRRRLPSIPSDQIPVSAPGSSTSHRVFLDGDLNVSDPAKQLELQRVKEMLSRKAAAIEKQRREEELRNLRIEADRQRVGAASERIARRRNAKPRGRFYSDGSVSDSEIGPTGSGRDSRDKEVLDTDWRFGAPALSMQTLSTIDSQQSPIHSAMYGLDPIGTPMSTVFLSKSEEDIIREIEKQVSETTGKAYQAYDRSEIEREVRRRYGALHDSDRSSSQQSSSSSGSKGSTNDSWSSVTFELSDHRLRAVRQKLKEELKLIMADKRAQLDKDAVTNEPARRVPRGKGSSTSQDSHMMPSAFLQSSRINGKPQLLAVPGMDKTERNGKPQNSSNRHSPQASPQRRRNRRQAADSIPPMFSPIKEDVDIEGEVLLCQSKLTKQHSDGQEPILLPQGEPALDRRGFRLRDDAPEEPLKSPISGETSSSNNRRRRKDMTGLVKIGPEEVDRLSREGEIIERQIREQQEKEFRRELERRKKQMEDSAKRLDELKVRRGVEWSANGAGGSGAGVGTGRTIATAPGPKAIQGPVKLSQSLDEIARRRERDTSPLSGERRRYGSLETVTRDKGRGARVTVSMSTPQLTDRERAIIRRDQQGLILPLDEETRLQKESFDPGKRQARTGRTDRLERSSSREKRPHRQDSVESGGSNRGFSEDDDAGYSDSSKGSGRRRRSTEERRATDESTRHYRHHGRTSPATQRERDHGRSSPSTQHESDHGRASPLYAQQRGHHHHRQQHNRSREDVSSSATGRERAHTVSPCLSSRERERERDLHRDHRRRQHHHSGEDLSKPSKTSERSTASQRSRSLPRVLQTDRRQASPEDYYYGDQVYRMQASEWTRRADDSGDDDDERQRQVIYQSVPGGSRHMQQRHISRNDYQFPTRRFRLPRDPRDKKCRNHGIGMRIIGGKRISGTDQLVAYIAEIRRGGVADREGLREGDQVLEWCGMPLTGRTYEEVQRITRTADGDVEVVVKCGTNLLESPRQRGGRPRDDSAPRSRSTSNPPNYAEEETLEEEAIRNGVDPRMLSERLEGISKAQYVYSSPTTSANADTSSPKRKGRHRNKKISGEIQIQLDYDEQTGDLSVGILRGRGLAPKDINGLADPFVKTCLLPGRGPENKRKTRYVPKTLTPEWNQTVLYRSIRTQELAARILEISVWDFDRFTFNDFMGQILIDLSDHHILDNRARWFSLQDQPASTGQHEAFSPRALSPITTLPSSHPGHPLSLLVGGRGRGGPSTTTGSGDHGSPERRRALSRSMERVQAASAAQQLLESDSQSSRSSGYEYDTDRSTQSDKSGWSQEHHRERATRTPHPSSHQHRHHNGHHNGHHQDGHADRDDRTNGTQRATTDNAMADHSGNNAAKEPSPSKSQPTKSSPTTSAETKPSGIRTSVKVTVTTKHPSNKRGSKETKEGAPAKKAPDITEKQPQDQKVHGRRETRRATSADRSSERAKLSPSNVRASKPKHEPSIFHYTSTNPSNRRDTESKKAFKKGASTSKSAQNLSSYHDQPSTSHGFRRSSAELYDGSRSLRLNGPENIDAERGGKSWPSDFTDSKTPQPIEVEVKQTGYDDPNRSQQGKDGESVLLNGGHDTERVGGVPSLWVRKPQLERGPGSTLEGNSLMQMNLKAAMYTRMFAGELGPGQIIDPETPRDYETTGEIRLGLKKESKADGDELYVDVIQCRKISYKFKTEHPPDLYVKGYLVVGDRKISKKKTHICKFTKEPKFNEVFMYNTSVTGLALQVSLWADGGRFGRNTLLGDTMIWLDNVPFLPTGEAEAWYKLLLPSGKSTSSP